MAWRLRGWRWLLLAVLVCAGVVAVPRGCAAAVDAQLELLIRVMMDEQVMPSCLFELVGLSPDAISSSKLVDALRGSGLVVTAANGPGRWLLTVAAAEPQPALPALLADGVIVRSEARRWGPVVVWHTYLTIGGPDGFLRQLRQDLASALPGVATALAGQPPAIGGGLSLPAAVRLEVPGRVVRSSAPAKAGNALHWDVRLDDDGVVLADVTSVSVVPVALGLWLVGALALAALLWGAGDVAIRSTRSRHGGRL